MWPATPSACAALNVYRRAPNILGALIGVLVIQSASARIGAAVATLSGSMGDDHSIPAHASEMAGAAPAGWHG